MPKSPLPGGGGRGPDKALSNSLKLPLTSRVDLPTFSSHSGGQVESNRPWGACWGGGMVGVKFRQIVNLPLLPLSMHCVEAVVPADRCAKRRSS